MGLIGKIFGNFGDKEIGSKEAKIVLTLQSVGGFLIVAATVAGLFCGINHFTGGALFRELHHVWNNGIPQIILSPAYTKFLFCAIPIVITGTALVAYNVSAALGIAEHNKNIRFRAQEICLNNEL